MFRYLSITIIELLYAKITSQLNVIDYFIYVFTNTLCVCWLNVPESYKIYGTRCIKICKLLFITGNCFKAGILCSLKKVHRYRNISQIHLQYILTYFLTYLLT